MAIEISNITKYYGTQKALDDVSLTVNSGEIVGLLGPNGAGKTTLMKIITCFIPPSSGTVTVNGYNIKNESFEIKKQVGYLPEHNPLYNDMYIKEYLRFVADIHKIPNSRNAIADIIEQTGLSKEQHKQIKHLSKGYRQRVGLAQALLPSPKVLILDEPTTGLDPNQLIEIRNLILEISKEKTIFLSTHIMQEVDAVCDRVVIINNGKIVADDTKANITKQTNMDIETIVIEFDKAIPVDILIKIPGIQSAKHITGNSWLVSALRTSEIRNSLMRFSLEKKISILSMHKEIENLEKVFHRLTNN